MKAERADSTKRSTGSSRGLRAWVDHKQLRRGASPTQLLGQAAHESLQRSLGRRSRCGSRRRLRTTHHHGAAAPRPTRVKAHGKSRRPRAGRLDHRGRWRRKSRPRSEAGGQRRQIDGRRRTAIGLPESRNGASSRWRCAGWRPLRSGSWPARRTACCLGSRPPPPSSYRGGAPPTGRRRGEAFAEGTGQTQAFDEASGGRAPAELHQKVTHFRVPSSDGSVYSAPRSFRPGTRGFPGRVAEIELRSSRSR